MERLFTMLQRKTGMERNGTNRKPLRDAAWKSSTETAKLLLKRGAAIEARDVNNGTSKNK